MTPELSIIVVSFNTREMTRACIDSIARETTDVSYELIVVDNASQDGSREALAGHPAIHRFIPLDDNIGFAQANNLAAKGAAGELVLLLNPDTVVLDHAIDKLVAFARRRPEAGIWGGRTLFADRSLNPTSVYARMTPWRLLCRATGLTAIFPRSPRFNGETYGAWRRDSERQVDVVTGCFFLIEKQLWTRLGGFNPTYFMYGEETDLCLRSRAFGARPLMTPDAEIIHYGGASEATRENKMVKLLAAKATLINHHFTARTRKLGLGLHALWPLTRWLALTLVATATGSRSAREKADVWGNIWRRRREWQNGYASATAATPDPVPHFDMQQQASR
ncbi:MAG: glycosyltransferase family 2 protein [Hyphomicrobiaceae bacterium]